MNNLISDIEAELSKLDLRSDLRKYINGFVQLEDYSIKKALFIQTENFYEDIIEVCEKFSTNDLIVVPYDLDIRSYVDLKDQIKFNSPIIDKNIKFFITDGNSAVVFLKENTMPSIKIFKETLFL